MAEKKQFTVAETETVADCLARMEREGYTPVRRLEKPVFEEQHENGQKKYVPIRQEIRFEGKKMS